MNNNCGNSSVNTKQRGPKSSETQEEPTTNSEGSEPDKGESAVLSSSLKTNDSSNPTKNTLVICQRNSNANSTTNDHSFTRFKPRNSGGTRNEFRMARGSNATASDRGRGNSRGRAFKKTSSERDSNVEGGGHSATRSKFQESLKNQENSQNKYYDDKRTNEDSRISKLLKRLSREEDYEHFLGLCKQVQESIVAPENQRYIRRHMDNICECLVETLLSGPGLEAKSQIAKCLGRIGYIVDQDFKRFIDWIFNKYSIERKDDVKCLLMRSLVETLKMDVETQKLKDFSMHMMSELQTTLENVDRADLLMATVDAILLIIDSYPETFADHFRDTVDILVGWHIDSTQQKSVVAYASRSLQKLHDFWIADLQFTLTLLGQFLEDMESYDEELTLPGSGRSSPGDEVSLSPRECILRITSLISVFNTVTKSITDQLNPNLSPSVQWNFLSDCLTKMLRTVVKAIKLNESNESSANNTTLACENTESLKKCMKSMNLSQKNVDMLLKSLNKEDMSEDNLVEMIKAMNVDRKSEKGSKGNGDKDKEREQSLINLLKSMELQKNDLLEEKEELIVVANECAYLLLGYLQSRVTKNRNLLYNFIELQLQRTDVFMDETIVSCLTIISKVIKEVSANLPLELVQQLLGRDSVLLSLRFRNSAAIQEAALGVYHSLLSLKNIPLLQEAYRYILADLEIAYKIVMPNIESLINDNPLLDMEYRTTDTEIVIIFLLRALSEIANANNSIIGMWALKPSILELLAVKLVPYDRDLSTTNPFLQYSIIYLLYAHCSRYNHFVPSSSLITGRNSCRTIEMFPSTLEVPTASPTSGHLSIILNVIAKTFDRQVPDKTLLLLSNWTQEIFLQAENCIGILSKNIECQTIIQCLLKCGATVNHEVAIAVCNNFVILLSAKNVEWSYEIYSDIVDLIVLHLTSCNKRIREKYSQLLMNVPPNIVILKLNKKCLISESKKLQEIKSYTSDSLILAQRLHMRGVHNGEMQAQHFKTYMAFILREFFLDERALQEIFTLCWPTVTDNAGMANVYNLALANCSFLYFWGGFEAAQHCVINKLRTPLGKPQETFTTIEGALKLLAREISYNAKVFTPKKDKRSIDCLLQEHTRVILLIEFLEHLERGIHNAAEGCATAMLPLSKPVRTFFHTNKSTCKEWLNRIRLALCVVSLHAGMATNALRNGQKLLEDLSLAENTQGPEFERATLCTAEALVMLSEAEALQGLYVYTKDKDRKFTWLKAAMEEAAGRYEAAADAYRQLLDEEICQSEEKARAEGNNQVVAFCMQHLIKCYKSIGDWAQLEAWKTQEEDYLSKECNAALKRQVIENISLQQVKCLRKFEDGETYSFKELSSWASLDEQVKTNWSCSKTITECSNALTNMALRINQLEPEHIDDIDRCKKYCAKIMQEGLRNVPLEYINDSLVLQYSATGLQNVLTDKRANVFHLHNPEELDYLGFDSLTQILWWSDYFSRTDDRLCTQVASLRLDVARSARKEGNFNLAKREIAKYFANEQDMFPVKESECHTFPQIVANILENPVHVKWTNNNMRVFRETAKLLCAMDNVDDALKVSSVTALGISQAIVNGERSAELREMGTKLLLDLGKWIQPVIKMSEHPQMNELLRFESTHNDGLMDKMFGETTELIPTSDMIIGRLMQLGVNQCPDLPLAWSSFAGWCYKWGRKIVDNSLSGQLTDTDRLGIQSLLPIDISESELNAVFTILSQNKTIPEDEGDIDTNDINTTEMIENQLRNVSVLQCASNEHIAMLVEIWRRAQKRIYSYYELSANAYFKYLQLTNNENNDCATITATLRLLRLVVKHALELQGVLEAGLATTPTGPWKEIIPQLFSRLSHPETYVRMRVAELLCRVAENSPHLITFPAVVGAVSGQRRVYSVVYQKDNDNENDNSQSDPEIMVEDDMESNIPEENQSFLDTCFLQLAECLSNKIQDCVEQVKILVKELRRITLLWDELWLATLCQHHGDIAKRFEQLEIEIQKVHDNIWLSLDEKDKLIAAKHRIIMRPIIFILENLKTMTDVPAETPHEKYFQDKFAPAIDDVINKLKNPKNPAKPQTAALPLKQLEAKLSQKINKRGAYSLLMSDISPILANLKDTHIAMPGVCSSNNRVITIQSVDNSVQILPTKTKPKKLMFHGSDGRVYTYLFKGLEDLHLDERIMQFLSICNAMMAKNNETKNVYRARHYSVIPLGPRSGLIQWVDGVTPLFALYKRWQQRESAMTNKSGNSGILRPSELFYNKLAPLLKERGIGLENRKEWPLPVLKQVLTELMNETPKDLLAKEIWCNSINAGSWWQATKNYSYSVAVMSIIGYIIGLGDRHLDNVLVDLHTGEVVHIDYNVCFEKGKTLRVPEKVPFRMTMNIKTALGVTGVEGIFRLACEHTLRMMRRRRETLLTLLEAFVYDPLVDWRAGAENAIASYGACQARARCTGIGRKQLERELTKEMFAVRASEMRAEWLTNRDDLARAFPGLSQHLSCWIETTEVLRKCQDLLQDRHQQLGLVKEAQAMGRSHALYSIIKRYNSFKRARDSHEKAKAGLKEKIDECEKQINMHNISLATVRGPQIGQWIAEMGVPSSHEDHLVFDLVKEFLQNAGQSQMIVQCEQSENELTQLATQQSLLIRSCLDLLSQYSAICSLYPNSTLSQHRSVAYHAWANKLLTTGSIEACHEVMAQLEASLNPASINNNTQVQQIIAFSYHLQTLLAEANERFKKSCERMIAEGLPEALGRIDKAYAESRSQIVGFLRREKGAEKALECVNITALCAINKRYLMMEGAAKCAGDCLVDLTSREGDWFLDEMRSMSSLIAELVTLIPDNHKANSDTTIALVLKCLKGADNIYKGLQELNYNFHTIILPETMKTTITEEPTVLLMLSELDDIIMSTGMSLREISAQLEMHLRLTVMEMDSPHAPIQNVVAQMRLRFEALLSRPADIQESLHQDETLTPGQMLLMGFNGLFEKLQMEGNVLISTLSSLDIPTSWRKIDHIREAKEMAAPIFNESTRGIFEDIFLIKRLHTIQEFFMMCRETADAFKGGLIGNQSIYDDERLNKPVKVFTADYVARQLLGVTSQTLAIALCFLLQRLGLNVTMEIEQRDIGAESKVSLEELCRKLVDLCIKRGLFTSSVLGQASTFIGTLENSWRRKQAAKLTQQAVEIARASVQRIQLQFTVHHWLHEDTLLLRPNMSPMVPLNRPTFMLEMRKTAATLANLQSRVCEARDQQQNLVASLTQRLKWAAGANPALGEVMAAFDNAVLMSCEKLAHQHNLATIISTTCNSILHYEALRTRTSESVTNDANFIKLVKYWEESCMLTINLTATVSPIEESLIELLQIENNIDVNWLRQAEMLISDAIVDTQKRLEEKQDALMAVQEGLKEHVANLQSLLAEHHKLMSDVRTLLKSMAKQENIAGLQEFLAVYRSFTETIAAIVKNLEAENIDIMHVSKIKEELDSMAITVPPLYDQLLEFANECKTKDESRESAKTKAKLIRQESVNFSPRKGVPLTRDPTTGKAVQERNAYALNVWRRVRMKLEGRDPNPTRKYTTAEQVEYVIREAQNFDNLALLYEGWTPWV